MNHSNPPSLNLFYSTTVTIHYRTRSSNHIREVAREFLALLRPQAFDTLHTRKCSDKRPRSDVQTRIIKVERQFRGKFDVWIELDQGIAGLREVFLIGNDGVFIIAAERMEKVNADSRDEGYCCLRKSLTEGQGCCRANPEIECMGFVKHEFCFPVNMAVDTKDRCRYVLWLVFVYRIAKFCVVQVPVEP